MGEGKEGHDNNRVWHADTIKGLINNLLCYCCCCLQFKICLTMKRNTKTTPSAATRSAVSVKLMKLI